MTTAELRAAPQDEGSSFKYLMGLALGPLLALLLWFLPLSPNPLVNHALAITAFMVVYWIFEPIDHGITALIGCYLFWALGVAQFETAFAGFANSTPWFLFGAMLMGEAALRSGLAQRIGRIVIGVAGTSYAMLLFSAIALVVVLNLLVPSGMAELAILAPIFMGVVAAFGVDKKSNIGRGLFVIITYGCGLFNKMILSGASSILTRGLLEKVTGEAITWSQYFIAFLPATILTVIASWAVIRWLYPPEKTHLPADRKLSERAATHAPWSGSKKGPSCCCSSPSCSGEPIPSIISIRP